MGGLLVGLVQLQPVEMLASGARPFPHAADEIQETSMKEHLDYAACGELFEHMRHASRKEARTIVLQRLDGR